jgi:hypothetical protein
MDITSHAVVQSPNDWIALRRRYGYLLLDMVRQRGMNTIKFKLPFSLNLTC